MILQIIDLAIELRRDQMAPRWLISAKTRKQQPIERPISQKSVIVSLLIKKMFHQIN